MRKKQITYTLFALGGIFIGWLLFSRPTSSTHLPEQTMTHDHEGHSHDLEQDESGVWTCSMHPQIRMDKPGKCPICAMDLIPLKKNSGENTSVDPSAIQLSDEAAALADVQTTRISREKPVKKVRLYGKITPDERSFASQTAYVGGRIENYLLSLPARKFIVDKR